MSDSLFGMDPRKGMFRRYEIPLHMLCLLEPILSDTLLANLVMEATRRLRQLDRFYEEAWTRVHRVIETEPPRDQFKKDLDRLKNYITATEDASDAAEAFYLFGFRVLDITRELNKRICNIDFLGKRPKNFMNVRNHLVVHPENFPGKVLSWSVEFINKDDRGVVLKGHRDDAEKAGHFDPGLGPNAVELQSSWKGGSRTFTRGSAMPEPPHKAKRHQKLPKLSSHLFIVVNPKLKPKVGHPLHARSAPHHVLRYPTSVSAGLSRWAIMEFTCSLCQRDN